MASPSTETLSCIYCDLKVSLTKAPTYDPNEIIRCVNAILEQSYGITYKLKTKAISNWSAVIDPINEYLHRRTAYNITFSIKKEKIASGTLPYKNVRVMITTVSPVGTISINGVMLTSPVDYLQRMRDSV
nr:MAG: hypothetical protein [Dicrocoelium Rhabdo-like virus 1]